MKQNYSTHLSGLSRWKSLKRVNMLTYLGIIFDETISWAPHIQYILSKAGKRLGLLSW